MGVTEKEDDRDDVGADLGTQVHTCYIHGCGLKRQDYPVYVWDLGTSKLSKTRTMSVD